MRVPDFLLNFFVDLSFFLYPLLVVFVFALPFIVLALRKKRFTLFNSAISVFVGIVLVGLVLYGTYWGIAYLQGEAFKALYGIQ